MAPKNVADHFLNVQFGWKPFLKDIMDFDYVIQNYSKLAASRKDRNDKWIRRKFTPHIIGSSEPRKIDEGIGYKLDPFLNPADWFLGDARWELWEQTQSYLTGVGSFKFYLSEFDAKLPEFDSRWNQMRRVLDISGLRISPHHIWQATPWTWAIDWVTNVGDHIRHVQDTYLDNIACKYCYLMLHQTKTRTFKCTIPWTFGSPQTFEFVQILESKQREAASSPYGFSLSWSDLTPTQIAIAGALGITRM